MFLYLIKKAINLSTLILFKQYTRENVYAIFDGGIKESTRGAGA